MSNDTVSAMECELAARAKDRASGKDAGEQKRDEAGRFAAMAGAHGFKEAKSRYGSHKLYERKNQGRSEFLHHHPPTDSWEHQVQGGHKVAGGFGSETANEHLKQYPVKEYPAKDESFAKVEHSLAHKKGVHDPKALAAWIGREHGKIK